MLDGVLNGVNRHQIQELGEESVLRQILSSFSKATGLQASIVDSQGETIVTSEKEEKYCEFCQMVRTSETGVYKCKRSYARAGLEASKYGKPYIFRCHAGLIAWAAPILIEENYLGAIVCGQVLAWEPEDFFWEEIKEMTRGLGVDVSKLIECAQKLEVLSGEKIQAAADLLFVVANHIMKTGMITLQQRRAISEQQARLGEEIQARKKLEEALKKMDSLSVRGYSLEKERELVSRVRQGDGAGALRLLNEILAEILQRYLGNVKEVKARILELVVLISRAAVEGGASLKQLLALNSQYVEEFTRLTTVEEACHWIENVTQQFIICIEESKGSRNLQVIQKAGDYMRNNYRKKITLEDVAQAVYLSPCHLSKIFKQELGCTIMEFLTKIRIEEAKKLLRDPKYNVIQVADDLGFRDPGYFTKVFKRSEGITPSQYREKAF
ncbi:PocR ligand-binding domain-containing protein [Zhaonella formicivorans]|uniref:PocR ligand-binding domain-containing protein n=1 Tax=Zhaonella formicivorans TaxID=2528593 RepID=UPI0010F215F6|nr:PocR ligand-binding domain-containing protein [Zhaonella formicivorans]